MATARTDKTDKLEELHHRLTAQVEALVSGDDWKAMLDVAARLHRYRTGGTGISELGECPGSTGSLTSFRQP